MRRASRAARRPARAERRRQDIALVARFVGVGIVGGVLAAVAADQSAVAAPPWLIGVAVLAGALLLAAGGLAVRGYEAPPGRPFGLLRRSRTDRETGGLRRVERLIETGLAETDRFNLRVRPWLVELADQRLRHRADVDLQHDPDTARTLLGGSLWQLTQQPATTAPSRAQLADWISRLEQL
jgi:hypothetical protein